MKSKLLLCATGVLFLIATGCYNDPETSRKFPGQGPENYTSRPAVGPGTTAGGATAGPQPMKREAEGHAKKEEHGEPAAKH